MKEKLLNHLNLKGVIGGFETITEPVLAEFERSIGSRLPADYRHFLLNYTPSLFANDVVFTTEEPCVWASKGVMTLDVFYGFSRDPDFDIRYENRVLEGLPESTIAIAYDSGSNLILLVLPYGEIRFFDRETRITSRIASNFTKFIESFRLRDRPGNA